LKFIAEKIFDFKQRGVDVNKEDDDEKKGRRRKKK
jgi:hypothetical protein